jgi:2,3-dihydroxybenzoate decarboxylase
MLRTLKCPVIALEEHYWDKELAALFVGVEGVRDPEILKRLYDLGEVRLREMDEAGIDVQILSHGPATARGSSITRTSSVRGCVSMPASGRQPDPRRGSR